jgi:hypothetical protein
VEQGLDPDSRAQGFVPTCVGHADGAVKLDACKSRRYLITAGINNMGFGYEHL